MNRKVQIFIFVIMVGVITAILSFFETGDWNLFILLKASIIAGVLEVIIKFFVHYGWRIPLLGVLSPTPNIRGAWRFETPNIYQIQPPAKYEHLSGGFIVVKQSHSQIKITILWDSDEPSELRTASPVAVSGDMCAFTGIYVEQPGNTYHSFGSFITFSEKYPSEFFLRYRTDNNITGELKAKSRISKFVETASEGKKSIEVDPTWWQKTKFNLSWM